MADGVTLGFLKFVLDLDTDGFKSKTDKAQGLFGELRQALIRLDEAIGNVGKSMTKKITLPVVGIGAAVVKVAGDFESSMGKVAISTGATGDTFDRLRKLAIGIGNDTVFGAGEAAGAIDELAKVGLSSEQILGGAAKATADLAAATGSELAPAATAVSDTMQQFRLQAGQLPGVVNVITGAVNQSKLSFNDYQQALAQGGGVAAGLGVDFIDFNTALAATSSLFSSGSDAGTSFKTFLTRLVPGSKAAENAIRDYGLSFFDAAGKMRPIGDIAEQLKVKLGGLSDAKLNDVMSTIFGQDAMRTGIALMRQGSDGLDGFKQRILATDAAAQSAERMKGFNAQIDQLKGAFESLAIAIADTGLLTFVTSLVSKVTAFVSSLATANPVLLKIAAGFAAFAAALGPIAIIALPLFIARMGPLGMVFTAIVNPIGTAISVLARLAVQFGGVGAGLRLLAPLVLRFLGPIGLVVTAFQLFGPKVFPVLKELWATAQRVLGPELQKLFAAIGGAVGEIQKAFGELMSGPAGAAIRTLVGWIGDLLAAILKVGGTLVIGAIKALVQLLTGAFQVIGGVIRVVVALLKGDFSGAWQAAKGVVKTVVDTLVRVIESLVPGAIGALKRLVDGVREWLGAKLSQVMDLALAPIRKVKDAFFGLYDAVVGHSYIPDMVDEVGQHIGRLDTLMVAPVRKMTDAAAQAFQALQGKVQGVLDRLFPEEAAVRDATAQIDALDEALAKHLIKPEVWGAARARLTRELHAATAAATARAAANDNGAIGAVELVVPPVDLTGIQNDWERVQDTVGGAMEGAADQSRAAWADIAQSAIDGVQGVVGAIKGGGLLDILGSVLDVFTQLAGMGVFGKTLQTNVNKPQATNFGGFRALGGPAVPGKSYIVGENGPEWFTPRARGFVTPNGAGRGGGIAHIVPSPYFNVVVDHRAGGQVARAAPAMVAGGSADARSRMATQRDRMLA